MKLTQHLNVWALFLVLGFGSTSLWAVENYEDDSYWQEYSSPTGLVNFEANIGLHMLAEGFGTQVTFYQHLTPYFHVGQSFQYFRNDQEDSGLSQLHYGLDLNMRLAPFQEYMFAPFASVAFGYNQWQGSAESLASARVNYDLGLSIQLSEFFSLVLVHKDITFMEESPDTYWGQGVEGKTVASTEAMLTFSLTDKMF